MHELERDIFKIAAIGLFSVVAIKAFQNSGGIATIVKAVFGGYNDTLGTLAKT